MPTSSITKNFARSDSEQVEVYADVIKEESNDTSAVSGNGKPALRKAGKREGQIKMAEDFDAPLEDFKEYM